MKNKKTQVKKENGFSIQNYFGYEIKVVESGEKSRYNNKNCYCNGYRFDSIKECRRYIQLLLMEKSGYIRKLRRQTPFILQDEFIFRGEKIDAIMYYADFDYYDEKGNYIVEDVKRK